MVAGFLHGVENVAELDEVPAPSSFRDVDASARNVIEGAMPHGDSLRHGNLHRGGSASQRGRCGRSGVLNDAVRGIVVGLRSGRAVDLIERMARAAGRAGGAARGGRQAHEGHAAGAGFRDVAAADRDPAVVPVHEYRVAAQLVEEASSTAQSSAPSRRMAPPR